MNPCDQAADVGGRQANDMHGTLRTFLRAAFSFVQARLEGRVAPEDLRRIGTSVLDELRNQYAPVSWDTAQPVTIRCAKRIDMHMQGVRLVGHITLLRDPQVISLPAEDGAWEDSETTCAAFVDLDGDTIETIGITDRSLIGELQERRRRGGVVEVLGMIVLMPARVDPKRADHAAGNCHRAFYLYVVDVRLSSSALDLIAATSEERSWTANKLAELRERAVTPLNYLHEQLVTGLAVVGLDRFPLLGQLIEFTVLQAVSAGRVGQSSGRIHILVVGPPGQGKKLPALAAQVLSVACVQLSASRVTAAGLVGTSHSTPEGWRSEPGALVRAAHGVAVLQDAHGLSDFDLRKLGPVLQEVIEDGIVRNSVAGGHTWETPVALVVDLNRVAHLASAGPGGLRGEAALARLRPLLSRIDVIAEIPSDAARSWHIGAKMLRNLSQTTTRLEHQSWAREARLLVSALRDNYPTVDVEPVRDAMAAQFEEIRRTNEALFASRDDAGDLATRTAVSMTRLVLASARACARERANQEDVDRAVTFINMKLRFLALLPAPFVHLSSCPTDRSSAREEWVRGYAGQVVKSEVLAQEYQRQTGEAVSERTIRRDIVRAGGLRQKNDGWLLPSSVPCSAAPGTDLGNRTVAPLGPDVPPEPPREDPLQGARPTGEDASPPEPTGVASSDSAETVARWAHPILDSADQPSPTRGTPRQSAAGTPADPTALYGLRIVLSNRDATPTSTLTADELALSFRHLSLLVDGPVGAFTAVLALPHGEINAHLRHHGLRLYARERIEGSNKRPHLARQSCLLCYGTYSPYTRPQDVRLVVLGRYDEDGRFLDDAAGVPTASGLVWVLQKDIEGESGWPLLYGLVVAADSERVPVRVATTPDLAPPA